MATPLDAKLHSCSIEEVWFIWTELSDIEDDDDRVRNAIAESVSLAYGPNYDQVCFESASGTQFCRARPGAHDGEQTVADSLAARVLSFSIPRDPQLLSIAIEAIRQHHSYEEPVIYIKDGYATRADETRQQDNPNRYWNRA